MGNLTIGLLHPGEMGAAVGQCLAETGHQVLWVPEGRSPATGARAAAAGLTAAGLAGLIERSDIIMSVCPPHAALEVARQVTGFGGIYLDANAISPATARKVAALVEAGGASYVDGGIIGTPPVRPGFIQLYLSGPKAGYVRDLFDGSPVDARVVDHGAGAGAAATGAGAAATGAGAVGAAAKGWRWIAEMEEIAATMAAAGLPEGFHQAAAEIYRRFPPADSAGEEAGLDALVRKNPDRSD